MEPVTRKEKLLAAIASGNYEDFQPVNREEAFLKMIAEKSGSGEALTDEEYAALMAALT